jgi:hypothetical protein
MPAGATFEVVCRLMKAPQSAIVPPAFFAKTFISQYDNRVPAPANSRNGP